MTRSTGVGKGAKPRSLEQVLANVIIDGECWLWKGSRAGEYGRIVRDGRSRKLNRWVFEQVNGYLPPVVRHTCDTPLCIRPKHLVAGTLSLNTQDSVERGRHHNATKTHCKHGHEFTSANTGRQGAGRRYCLTCHAARERARNARSVA